ncbi:MAG: monovalent cation/H(+) antiporter subunit G [Actinomycetota bacterium]
MDLRDIAVVVVAAIGAGFLVVSSVGILRLPDTLTRMHAAGKAATLGVGCLMLASGIAFGAPQLIRTVVLILLFFITAPVATSALSRASYRRAGTDGKFLLLFHDDIANDRMAATTEDGEPSTPEAG